jgi:hypothetical protein
MVDTGNLLSYISLLYKGTALRSKSLTKAVPISEKHNEARSPPPSGKACKTVRTRRKADDIAPHRRFFRIKWSMSRHEPGAFHLQALFQIFLFLLFLFIPLFYRPDLYSNLQNFNI